MIHRYGMQGYSTSAIKILGNKLGEVICLIVMAAHLSSGDCTTQLD